MLRHLILVHEKKKNKQFLIKKKQWTNQQLQEKHHYP